MSGNQLKVKLFQSEGSTNAIHIDILRKLDLRRHFLSSLTSTQIIIVCGRSYRLCGGSAGGAPRWWYQQYTSWPTAGKVGVVGVRPPTCLQDTSFPMRYQRDIADLGRHARRIRHPHLEVLYSYTSAVRPPAGRGAVVTKWNTHSDLNIYLFAHID